MLIPTILSLVSIKMFDVDDKDYFCVPSGLVIVIVVSGRISLLSHVQCVVGLWLSFATFDLQPPCTVVLTDMFIEPLTYTAPMANCLQPL